MYAASNAFHEAVANGQPQIALMIFSDAVLTNEDIDVDGGIEFTDYFNTEEELSVGQALSNELSFAVFNDDGLLSGYAFGTFTATIGARIAESTYTESAYCSCTDGTDTYTGHAETPYLRKNGTAVAGQPGFAVRSLLLYDGTLYAFGANGACWAWSDGEGSSFSLNAFMIHKAARWDRHGYAYSSSSRILIARDGDGTQETYEFVPLGVFIADRPNVPDQIRVDFHCNDRMTLLDADMPTAENLSITYPVTLGGLFTALCTYYSIEPKSVTFINSTKVIPAEPEVFRNSTARTVLAWIAEAAASNARMDRDGKLVMDWVRSGGAVLDENGYVSFQPYWYETTVVDKIHNRDTQGSEEKTCGTGSTPYLIQDNPILKGCT